MTPYGLEPPGGTTSMPLEILVVTQHTHTKKVVAPEKQAISSQSDWGKGVYSVDLAGCWRSTVSGDMPPYLFVAKPEQQRKPMHHVNLDEMYIIDSW